MYLLPILGGKLLEIEKVKAISYDNFSYCPLEEIKCLNSSSWNKIIWNCEKQAWIYSSFPTEGLDQLDQSLVKAVWKLRFPCVLC